MESPVVPLPKSEIAPPPRVLMVCLGNICRSPVAAGVMQALAAARGQVLQVDSAGTAGWHTGIGADRRAIAEAARHGVDIRAHRARALRTADFREFDAILVMDRENLREVRARARSTEEAAKVCLLDASDEVPDPYYDDRLFAPVHQQITRACEKWLGLQKSDVSALA